MADIFGIAALGAAGSATAAAGSAAAAAASAAEAAASAAAASAMVWPRRNLLDNPRFKVNQRGQSSYTGFAYGLDRWRGYNNTTNVTVVTNGIQLSSQAGGWMNFAQNISDECFGMINNKVVTISVLTTGGLYYATGTLNKDISAAISSNPVRNIHIDYSHHRFILYGRENDTWPEIVRAVKLELGDTQTLCYQDANGNWQLYDDYDYLADLQECQRYYKRLENLSGFTRSDLIHLIASECHFVTTPTITNPSNEAYVIDTTSGQFVNTHSASMSFGATYRATNNSLEVTYATTIADYHGIVYLGTLVASCEP